jgi:hypothetical protein
MNRLSFRYLTVFVLIFSMGISVCNAQTGSGLAPKPKGFLGGIFSGKKSGSKIAAPKSVNQIKKDQAKKKKKDDADYARSVKESQKRTIKIQTPEVQNRMKQDQKQIADRDKAKKKKTSPATRKAGRKYKK